MDRREALLRTLRREPVEETPVSLRLELWYADSAARGALPDEVAGCSCAEIEDHLGWGRTARLRGYATVKLPDAEVATSTEGDVQTKQWRLPGRTLTQHARRTEEMARQGIKEHVVEYPLKEAADYEALTAAFRGAEVRLREDAFRELDAATGDAGLPIAILHSCPAHKVMLEYAGYEQFYLHRADFPEAVDGLIAAIDAAYRERMWPLVAAGPAEVILHGNHFSGAVTPPPVFGRWFAPYFRDFNRLMHESGKMVCFHGDSDMGGLLEDILDCGFDCADCLATAPLVAETLEDYFDAWQGRVVCWGGLPGTIFDPTFPAEGFRRHVDRTLAAARGRGDFILGASDNVMPGAQWERLLYVARAAGTIG